MSERIERSLEQVAQAAKLKREGELSALGDQVWSDDEDDCAWYDLEQLERKQKGTKRDV